MKRAAGVSLKTYVDTRFAAIEDHMRMREAHMDERDAVNQRAILTALDGMNERLSGMNEVRGALSDAQATFASKESVDLLRSSNDRRLGAGAGLSTVFAYAVGAVGIAAAVAMFVTR